MNLNVRYWISGNIRSAVVELSELTDFIKEEILAKNGNLIFICRET